MTEDKRGPGLEPADIYPAFSLIGRILPHIGLGVGLFLSIPDWVRELGFFGMVLALCSSIILAARIVGAAIEKSGIRSQK
jgi:hypothetical protein